PDLRPLAEGTAHGHGATPTLHAVTDGLRQAVPVLAHGPGVEATAAIADERAQDTAVALHGDVRSLDARALGPVDQGLAHAAAAAAPHRPGRNARSCRRARRCTWTGASERFWIRAGGSRTESCRAEATPLRSGTRIRAARSSASERHRRSATGRLSRATPTS